MDANKLLEIADKTKMFVKELNNANKKIELFNTQEYMNEIMQYKTYEARSSFLKRALRKVYKEVYNVVHNFTKQDSIEVLLPLSLNCYNQDWDYVTKAIQDRYNDPNDFIHSITNGDGENRSIEDIIQVKSWGHIRPKYDVNFFIKVRNGLSHSKFDYDEENNKLIINMYQGTFVVEFDMYFMHWFPINIWRMSEQSSSINSEQRLLLINNLPCKTAYSVLVKNTNRELTNAIKRKFRNAGVNASLKQYIENIKTTLDADPNITLVDKIEILTPLLSVDDMSKELTESQADAIVTIFEYLGLTVEENQKVELYQLLGKDNVLLTFLLNDMMVSKEIAEDDKRIMLSRGVATKIDKQSKNIRPYQYLFGLMTLCEDVSESKFNSNIKQSPIPYIMDELCTFADIAYFNYVFNYLAQKLEQPQELASLPATDYFKENSYTSGKSISDTFYYIRNCVVHPNRVIKVKDVYILTDYERDGSLVFSAEIECDKFFELANLVVFKMKEHNITLNNTN